MTLINVFTRKYNENPYLNVIYIIQWFQQYENVAFLVLPPNGFAFLVSIFVMIEI
jgi:hypothetical protein